MEPTTASHTEDPDFGETCRDCKKLGADGSWIFFAMLCALMIVLVFKLRLTGKKMEARNGH
jgi:hypothetical protein